MLVLVPKAAAIPETGFIQCAFVILPTSPSYDTGENLIGVAKDDGLMPLSAVK